MTALARLKRVLAGLLCRPAVGHLVARLNGQRIRRGGVVIDTSAPVVRPEVKASLFWGFYESAEIRFVRRYLPDHLDVVELGASIGVVASHVARRLRPGQRLVCVEANEDLLVEIRRNVRRNAPDAAVEVVHGAIAYPSDGRGTVALAVAERNLDSHLDFGPTGRRSVREVPALSLSRVLEERGIGEYALVSDIEGAEAALIRYDDLAFARCRFAILELHATELDGRQVSVEEMREQLHLKGFRSLDRRGPVCALERSGGEGDPGSR